MNKIIHLICTLSIHGKLNNVGYNLQATQSEHLIIDKLFSNSHKKNQILN
jgi:hypothetical protein